VSLALSKPGSGEFPPGSLQAIDHLPASRLRTQIEGLPELAQQRAMRWLRSVHFTVQDLPSLHVDRRGGIFFACDMELAPVDPQPAGVLPEPGLATLPVSPFPASLVFHSRPGAPNVIYVNFEGENVTGTDWNDFLGRDEIPALPFSADTDYTTYNDTEQLLIKRVWQRMAEDYAPFNVDVTTERPAEFGARTAMALITGKTDANGDPNPYNSSGGVAYLSVFGTSSYAVYRPAWIYHDNLGNTESFVAEAASHEVGHNMGLSHDGKTDGTEYYSGHGTGDTSWGPLMGTGYNRNVTQWSKGDYYLANNSQDDILNLVAKLGYRTDDHGNTAGTATVLVVSNGTNITSTTPENDPTNSSPANKGVLERSSDLDVFSFITGNGPVELAVRPWIMPSGTRGGNLDIVLELRDEGGSLLLTNNPSSLTTSIIQTNLLEGRYYLHVRGTGTGDPLSSTPTGYTAYGSVGQYFVSGSVTVPGSLTLPPLAEAQVADLTQSGETSHLFVVTYTDDFAVDVATPDDGDIRVTGLNGFDLTAQFISVDAPGNGTPRTATYALAPPTGGTWAATHNGTYTLWMQAEEVGDTQGATVAAGQLAQFSVAVPTTVYVANMDVDPGWTLDPQWEYGAPSYSDGNPAGGYTGTKIIGYNLSGTYANNLPNKYATTPPINAAGSSALTLRFRRWLGLQFNDSASIQATTDGVNWLDVWISPGTVADTSWQEVQYPLPPEVAGSSSLQIRWVLSSNRAVSNIGWNLDDVEVLGDGTPDTTPPTSLLNVTDLTVAGASSHTCSVTYTDETAVRISSLDATDLQVTGPNGYLSSVEFVSADLPLDGSPVTASYSIPAPGGTWDAADNGTYTITLREGAVSDTVNNVTPLIDLGTFIVAISAATPGALVVTPLSGLEASGPVGGPFTPASVSYTLTNTGETALDWTAGATQSWINLSATSGTLAPGASTPVTAALNAYTASLSPGDYSATVSFMNSTTGDGNTTRSIALTVNRPGQLEVSPLEGWSSSGYSGGPFNPASVTVSVANTGETALEWTVSKTAEWLDLSVDGGMLEAGASTTLTLSLNTAAALLAAGTYTDSILVAAVGSDAAAYSLPVTLEVAAQPEFVTYGLTEPGVLQMVVQAIAGTEVIIEVSPDFQEWNTLSTNQVAADGTVTFTDVSGTDLPHRWYRARTVR